MNYYTKEIKALAALCIEESGKTVRSFEDWLGLTGSAASICHSTFIGGGILKDTVVGGDRISHVLNGYLDDIVDILKDEGEGAAHQTVADILFERTGHRASREGIKAVRKRFDLPRKINKSGRRVLVGDFESYKLKQAAMEEASAVELDEPLSEEAMIRIRVVKAVVVDEKSAKEASEEYKVPESTVYLWVRLFRERKQLRDLPRGGDMRSKDLTPYEAPLREFVAINKDAKPDDLVSFVQDEFDETYPFYKAKELLKDIRNSEGAKVQGKGGEGAGSGLESEATDASDPPLEIETGGLSQQVFSALYSSAREIWRDFHGVFSKLPDLRSRSTYELALILFVAMMSCMCGMDNSAGVNRFAKSRWKLLRALVGLGMLAKVMSHSTITRAFRSIDEMVYSKLHAEYMAMRREKLGRPMTGITISLDGKTMNHSKIGPKGQNVVSLTVMCHEYGDCLAIVRAGKLHKEVKAAHAAIDNNWVPVFGNTFAFDAMFTKRDLCDKIDELGGFYLGALRNNQPKMEEEATKVSKRDCNEETISYDEKHKNVKRVARVYHLTEAEKKKFKWPHIVTIGTYEVIIPGRKTYMRTFVVSRKVSSDELCKTVREHWGVEILHYILDVTLNEDSHQARMDNSPMVYAGIRRLALHHQKATESSISLKGDMELSALNPTYLMAKLTNFKDKITNWDSVLTEPHKCTLK